MFQLAYHRPDYRSMEGKRRFVQLLEEHWILESRRLGGLPTQRVGRGWSRRGRGGRESRRRRPWRP